MANLASMIRLRLQNAIREYPEEYFATFKYTVRGNNYTHPFVLGELVTIVSSLPKVSRVALDVRLNTKRKVKFQPDIVAYGRDLENPQPLLFVDYESPNSSDARIPDKDIEAYKVWRSVNRTAPYVIVTTLPDRRADAWELRYTAAGFCNHAHKGSRPKIRSNPFRFWVEQWKQSLKASDLENITILNINAKKVDVVRLFANT
jgi:hypothetical protein